MNHFQFFEELYPAPVRMCGSYLFVAYRCKDFSRIHEFLIRSCKELAHILPWSSCSSDEQNRKNTGSKLSDSSKTQEPSVALLSDQPVPSSRAEYARYEERPLQGQGERGIWGLRARIGRAEHFLKGGGTIYVPFPRCLSTRTSAGRVSLPGPGVFPPLRSVVCVSLPLSLSGDGVGAARRERDLQRSAF